MSMKIVAGTPTYDNASEYDDAMAEWHQTGFELSLMKDSESPEDYKEMMDSHMAEQPGMTYEVFVGYDPANCGDIPF